MSTVAEIEAAIEQLPTEQVREVAAWLEDYQAMPAAADSIFCIYDEEEANAANP